VAAEDILHSPQSVGTLHGMEERDVTVLMEAVFDIRSDVRDLLDMFREEGDDGQEEEDGES
jgi:hypothetical protein